MSTTSQACLIISTQMVLQRSMSNLSKACYTRPESQVNTHILALMLYRNTLLGHYLPFPMELLCARQVRSDLPMSNVARMQVNQVATKHQITITQSDIIRLKCKNQAQATGILLLIGTHVMNKTQLNKLLYPAVNHLSKMSWKAASHAS